MNTFSVLSQESTVILEVPTITLLGSLDDTQGTTNLGLSVTSSKPVFAILYNPI
ncbi:hypothetical protein AVHM3334_22895 [Acidovorax sp. SUPP3334]|nr:hypothetical protein AVHM3334_22895 [Acidovorax sp. SUPP3334]